jgi:ribose transport system ATP-binding protein
MTAPALEVRGVRKSFGQNRVLDDVDFEVLKGEIHALLGGNGAGKSTLMKILSGVYTLDEGTILVNGQPRHFSSAHDAQACGIATVFQEFSLIPTLTVAQNIFLTREARTRIGLLDDRAGERQAGMLLAEMDVDIDPKALVSNLSTGHQQVTEIAKALSQGADILILDEPSSSLTKRETESLFHLLRRLKDRGIAIIYISHRLEEIFEIADRITILRDGRRIVTDSVATTTMPDVIEGIVGRKMERSFEWKQRPVNRTGTPLLDVSNLASSNGLRRASLQVYPGEILGIAGLMGSGRTELARCLFGIDRIEAGEIRIRGRRVVINSAGAAIKAGIALIPEDRRRQGLVLQHTIKDNIVLSVLNRLLRGGLMNDRRADQVAASYVQQLAIKTESTLKPVELLSGGNQQKVVIAKWLATEPQTLIMDEPTIGVDIGTKAHIIAMIRELADEGKGIIVISSELPELLAVSDRILVMRDGVSDRALNRREIEEQVRTGHPQGQHAAAEEVAGAEEVLQRIVQGV